MRGLARQFAMWAVLAPTLWGQGPVKPVETEPIIAASATAGPNPPKELVKEQNEVSEKTKEEKPANPVVAPSPPSHLGAIKKVMSEVTLQTICGDPHSAANGGFLRRGERVGSLFPLVPQTPPKASGCLSSVIGGTQPVKMGKAGSAFAIVAGDFAVSESTILDRNVPDLTTIGIYFGPKGLTAGVKEIRYKNAGGNSLHQFDVNQDLSRYVRGLPKGTTATFDFRRSLFFPHETGGRIDVPVYKNTIVSAGGLCV